MPDDFVDPILPPVPATSVSEYNVPHLGRRIVVGLIGAGALLGAGLALGILALINRSLQYALPSEVSALSQRLDTLEGRVQALEAENTALTARVVSLEDLAERTTRLEQFALQIQSEVDKRVDAANELKGNITDLQERLGKLVTANSGVQTFIEGLRETWQKIFPGTAPP